MITTGLISMSQNMDGKELFKLTERINVPLTLFILSSITLIISIAYMICKG